MRHTSHAVTAGTLLTLWYVGLAVALYMRQSAWPLLGPTSSVRRATVRYSPVYKNAITLFNDAAQCNDQCGPSLNGLVRAARRWQRDDGRLRTTHGLPVTVQVYTQQGCEQHCRTGGRRLPARGVERGLRRTDGGTDDDDETRWLFVHTTAKDGTRHTAACVRVDADHLLVSTFRQAPGTRDQWLWVAPFVLYAGFSCLCFVCPGTLLPILSDVTYWPVLALCTTIFTVQLSQLTTQSDSVAREELAATLRQKEYFAVTLAGVAVVIGIFLLSHTAVVGTILRPMILSLTCSLLALSNVLELRTNTQFVQAIAICNAFLTAAVLVLFLLFLHLACTLTRH